MLWLKRFLDKIKFNPRTFCWNWTGCILYNGYGAFRLNNKIIKSHRFSYELFKDKIPLEMELDHLCKNRKCCNPEHLELVTHKENMKRGLKASTNKCPLGHLYSGNNLYVNPKGSRECKKCRKLAQDRFKLSIH